MKIKIFQINRDRDTKHVVFLALKSTLRMNGESTVDPSIYDKVFEGDVKCRDLEDVYMMFNDNLPSGYTGRSLSVSDVVQVLESDTMKQGCFFCDAIGFEEIPSEFATQVAG